jgi:hypothetical protein
LAGLAQSAEHAGLSARPDGAALDELTAAEIYLSSGMPREALNEALKAHDYFSSSGQRDSQVRSAWLAAAASKSLGDKVSYEFFSKKVVDILKELRQTWGPEPFETYLARPDVHSLNLRVQVKAQ